MAWEGGEAEITPSPGGGCSVGRWGESKRVKEGVEGKDHVELGKKGGKRCQKVRHEPSMSDLDENNSLWMSGKLK